MKLFCKFLILWMVTLISCHSAKEVDGITAYATHEVRCLGTTGDGGQILRVWGKGTDKSSAEKQAEKEAVHAVIFKGVTSGSKDCSKRPILTTPNAYEKHQDYFAKFFSSNGPFKKYVSVVKGDGLNDLKADAGIVAYSIVVNVNRTALRQKLIKDGILTQ